MLHTRNAMRQLKLRHWALALGFLTLLLPSLKAQEGIHIGVGFMPQNTWILNKDDQSVPLDSFSYKFTWGYAGMFKLGYNFGPPFGIHLAAFYSKQGQNIAYALDSGATEKVIAKRDLRMLKIPLLLHFGGSDPDRPVNLSVDVGPQLDIVLDAAYLNGDSIVNPSFDYATAFKLQNVSAAWSLGLDFRLADGVYFNVTHRGDYSLLDVENKELTLPGTTIPFYAAGRAKSNNLNLGLMTGFTFCFLPDLGGRGQHWIR